MVYGNLNSFVVADPQKCIGCRACELACAAVHSDIKLRTVGMMETPVIPRLYLVRTAAVTIPIQCRHCEDAPCANVCPVAAITQKDNVIFLDEDTCIGCKTCLMACPFGAIDLVPQYKGNYPVMQRVLKTEIEDQTGKITMPLNKMVANKCDLCLGKNEDPACIAACPENALELVSPIEEKKKRNQLAALNILESIKQFID